MKIYNSCTLHSTVQFASAKSADEFSNVRRAREFFSVFTATENTEIHDKPGSAVAFIHVDIPSAL